jgi:hypothetical protein
MPTAAQKKAAEKARRARNRFKGIRVVPAVEALAQATLWTEATLKVNPFEFVTGIVGGKFNPGGDGGAVITLPELLGAGPGGPGGNFGSYAANLPQAIQKNIGGIEGLVMTGLKSAGLGIGFRIFNRMTSKARSGINNQILKPLMLDDFVRF